ncbi:LOW QUALITY PROTEIN: hypothetical protein U9M48_041687 [Paspalum notatum var. saurae]|uniref:Uncharacterized protein n=1 Tax=Paspalum notatum var. saurae TaxID=547442 RepID=A0AAQ3UTI4_PASNO
MLPLASMSLRSVVWSTSSEGEHCKRACVLFNFNSFFDRCHCYPIIYLSTARTNLINWMDWFAYETVQWHGLSTGLHTNYYGTKQVTQALVPLLQSSSDGRIVNYNDIVIEREDHT